jgi:2'-5' RNA ligase
LFARLVEAREVNPDGTISCGVFIPLPFDIAREFPNKDHEDDSVPHLTMLYAGDMNPVDYRKLVDVVAKVVRLYEPFRIDLSKYGEFHNPEGQLIPHMIPRAPDMRMNVGILNLVPSSLGTMHEDLRHAVERAGLTVAHRYGPEADEEAPYRQNFKAHATLDYVPAGSTYDGPRPTGAWKVTEVECWGHEKYRVPLGVTQADQPGRPKLAEDKLPGGKGDKLKPSDVNADELKKGIEHELEHTTDREIAQEIALDHLAEDPKYYTHLEKIHKEALEYAANNMEWEGLVHVSADAVVGYDPIPGYVAEMSDLPSKHNSPAAPSNRTGLGTAPISDERPEQEKKDALRAALKKRKAKAQPAS